MEQSTIIESVHGALTILKGQFSIAMWIVLWFCSLCAILMSMYLQYKSKKQKGTLSEHNPEKFSISYFIYDNLMRIFMGMVAMFFIFRLLSILIDSRWLENDDMMIAAGLGVGFFASMGVDRMVMKLMEKSNVFDSPNPYKDAENKSKTESNE